MSWRGPWSLGALACVTTACRPEAGTSSPQTPAAPVASSPAAPTGPAPLVVPGDAVVRAGGRLFFASTGDAGVSLPPSSSPGFAVHVVDREDGRLVVEPLTTGEHHCAAALPGLAYVRVSMYVDESALVPVLAEHFDHAFADGTRVRLSRGVPVGADGMLFARGTAIAAPVDAGATGRSYAPALALPEEGGDRVLASLAGHPLVYDGHTLVEDELHRQFGGAVHYGAAERKDHALVTVRNACLELTARTSLERMRASTQLTGGTLVGAGGSSPPSRHDGEVAGLVGVQIDAEGGVLGSTRDGDDGIGFGRISTPAQAVKAGAAISWPDGRAAGTVVHDHRIVAAPRDDGDRRCFDVRVGVDATPTLPLCFAAADLKSSSPGLGGRGKAIPQVAAATAVVKGGLDKDIIRRIVRAHINEVRHCYHRGLGRDPDLAGKVTVSFTIDATGVVSSSKVAESTLGDAEVGDCITTAVARWKFPKPEGGGDVNVTYPFTLAPG